MVTIGKKVLSLLLLVLLVCIGAAPLGCLTINKPPDNRPTTEVNVSGEHGVTVDRDKRDNKPKTEVNVGGEHGVTVDRDKSDK
jgi:hypothetical protein